MSGPFKVGGVVEGVGFVINTEANGMECTILTAPEFGEVFCGHTGQASECIYCAVEWADGTRDCQPTSRLRRRKPPTTDSGELLIQKLIRDTLDKAPMRVKKAA